MRLHDVARRPRHVPTRNLTLTLALAITLTVTLILTLTLALRLTLTLTLALRRPRHHRGQRVARAVAPVVDLLRGQAAQRAHEF